jgi:hypothetical protein
MKMLKNFSAIFNANIAKTGLMALVLGIFASSCIYIEDGPDPILEVADIEVRVHTPSGFAIEGAEITLYRNYQDALNYRYSIGTGYTDRYGIMCFHELPAGRTYFVRAQGSQAFSLGEVYVARGGLWVLPMELI